MPYRYRIDFRWDTLTDLKKWRKKGGQSVVRNHGSPATGHGVRTDRRGGGHSHTGRGSDVSRKRCKGQTLTSATGLATPWLPTGRYVTGLSLTRAGLQPQNIHKATLKALGVIVPAGGLHTDARKNHFSFPQTEDQLGRRVNGEEEEEEVNSKVGGQLEEHQQFQNRLVTRLPPIQDSQHGPETQRGLKEPEDIHVQKDPGTVSPSLSSPPSRTPTHHILLPTIQETGSTPTSTRSVRADLTVGVMSGEKNQHEGHHGGVTVPSASDHPAQNHLPKEHDPFQGSISRSIVSHDHADTFRSRPRNHDSGEIGESGKDQSPVESFSDQSGVPGPEENCDNRSDQHPSPACRHRPKDRVLRVEKKALSWRAVNGKNEPELERGLDVLCTEHQPHPDTESHSRTDPKTALHCTPSSPREVLSTPSVRQQHGRPPSRDTVSVTPDNRPGVDQGPGNRPLPSPTVHARDPGSLTDGRPLFWNPRASRLDHAERPDKRGEERVEGRSTVIHTPSKIMLNVVLPRAVRSREGRWCGQQRSIPGQKPLRAWLSPAPSSPPPPPPSALTDARHQASDEDGELEDEAEEADNGDNGLDTHHHSESKCTSDGVDGPSSQKAPAQQGTPTQQPSEDSLSFRDSLTQANAHLQSS